MTAGAMLEGGVLEQLDAQLRQAVRRDGIDPLRDSAEVRRLAQLVVSAHDERSVTGAVRPLADPAGTVAELVDRVAGLGPLQRFLDDPEVEENRT